MPKYIETVEEADGSVTVTDITNAGLAAIIYARKEFLAGTDIDTICQELELPSEAFQVLMSIANQVGISDVIERAEKMVADGRL